MQAKATKREVDQRKHRNRNPSIINGHSWKDRRTTEGFPHSSGEMKRRSKQRTANLASFHSHPFFPLPQPKTTKHADQARKRKSESLIDDVRLSMEMVFGVFGGSGRFVSRAEQQTHFATILYQRQHTSFSIVGMAHNGVNRYTPLTYTFFTRFRRKPKRRNTLEDRESKRERKTAPSVERTLPIGYTGERTFHHSRQSKRKVRAKT